MTETSGREVFTIALTAQINLDPARRSYDADTRPRSSTCSASPSAGRATHHSILVGPRDHPRAQLHRHATSPSDAAATTSSWRRPVPLSLPDGEAPLSFHFTGSVLHRGDDARCRSGKLIPWTCSAQWRMPVATWREMMARHYPGGAWVRLRTDTLDALRQRTASHGLPSYDACVAEAAGGRPDMDPALDELLGTLLFEGYALYPYTPGATKNATPTPFGIVYPPIYAQSTPSTFEQLRMQGIARAAAMRC